MLPIILVAIAIALLIFLDMYLELERTKNTCEEEKKSNLKIVDKTIQDMYDIMGETLDSESKIKKLNKILIKAFKPKYSSIVLFDGNKYILKATNVEKHFTDSILNVATEPTFRKYVNQNTSKYLVRVADKPLAYKSAIERNIKSAIFSPIYYNSMFLGFWFIEDIKENAFDGISLKDLDKFKHNLSLFVENLQIQNTIEMAGNIDKQTGFYNNLYLYSEARAKLISHDTSSISLIYFKNIPDINEKYGRNIGNALIVKIANSIKEIVSKESILVRYSGLSFVIITPGSNAQVAQSIMEKVLSKIKSEVEYLDDDKIVADTQILIHTLKKQNNVEKEIQDMILYADEMKAINTIKII